MRIEADKLNPSIKYIVKYEGVDVTSNCFYADDNLGEVGLFELNEEGKAHYDSIRKDVAKIWKQGKVKIITVPKILVFVSSPYRGDIETNTKKAIRYCRFAYEKGRLPVAPHLYLTRIFSEVTEREIGMELGLMLLSKCKEMWAFGTEISQGMRSELEYARKHSIPVKWFDEKCVPL